MKYRIKPARQVVEFTSALPPDARRECKRALAALAGWKGNIIPLAGRLSGYNRLRVRGYRFIFAVKSGMVIEVVFAKEREIVYQLFEAMLHAGETEPLT